MGSKIKGWHRKKPRHHKDEKRIIPLRSGGDERLVPLRVHNGRRDEEWILDDEEYECR